MKMEGTEFDRSDIARNIVSSLLIDDDGAQIEKYDVHEIIDVLKSEHATIADALCTFDGRVEIKDFGTFTLELRAPDSGVDPNGEPWETPERYKVKFKAAPAFLAIIEERTGIPAF